MVYVIIKISIRLNPPLISVIKSLII